MAESACGHVYVHDFIIFQADNGIPTRTCESLLLQGRDIAIVGLLTSKGNVCTQEDASGVFVEMQCLNRTSSDTYVVGDVIDRPVTDVQTVMEEIRYDRGIGVLMTCSK